MAVDHNWESDADDDLKRWGLVLDAARWVTFRSNDAIGHPVIYSNLFFSDASNQWWPRTLFWSESREDFVLNGRFLILGEPPAVCGSYDELS